MQMDERGRVCGDDQQNASSLAEFNQDQYLPYLTELDLEEAQKRELIAIVWNIMRMWVEMDLPLDCCGQILEALLDPATNDSGDVQ